MSKASTAEDMLAAATKAGVVTDEGRILLHRGISSELRGVDQESDLSTVDFDGVAFQRADFWGPLDIPVIN